MPAIGTLITFVPLTTLLSADVNSNFSALKTAVNTYCLFVDTATTISGANTFSALQTFTAGVTLSGSSNLSVAGTSTLTGNVTIGGTLGVTGAITGTLTGNVTGNVTGNASTATALATARDITLTGDVTGTVSFNGTATASITAAIGTGVIVNADINAAAAIAYSKLALTGAILNADLAGSIAYAKLTLTGAIVNADISASAAIASSKLATVAIAQGGTGITTTPTNGKLLIGNGTGYTSATLTAGTNITITNGAGTITIASSGGGSGPADGDYGDIVISGSGSVYTIDTGVIVDGQISASAAIADTKLATISTSGKVANSATTAVSTATADKIVLRDGSGNFAAGAVTVSSIQNGGVQVLGARITGYAPTWTSVIASRTENLSTSVLQQDAGALDEAATKVALVALASFVKAMYDDLVTHGPIGA